MIVTLWQVQEIIKKHRHIWLYERNLVFSNRPLLYFCSLTLLYIHFVLGLSYFIRDLYRLKLEYYNSVSVPLPLLFNATCSNVEWFTPQRFCIVFMCISNIHQKRDNHFKKANFFWYIKNTLCDVEFIIQVSKNKSY